MCLFKQFVCLVVLVTGSLSCAPGGGGLSQGSQSQGGLSGVLSSIIPGYDHQAELNAVNSIAINQNQNQAITNQDTSLAAAELNLTTDETTSLNNITH